MTDMEYVLETMKRFGKVAAQNLQDRSPEMDGTQLYAEEDYIPSFAAAVAKQNMLTRKAGLTDGFVCKSSAGRVVRLIQNYDSTIYTQEPEELPAQWGFVWSNDPAKARPFISISTSPYNTGNCCTENGRTYRSDIDNNVWAPSAYPDGWTDITPVPEPEPEPEPAPEPDVVPDTGTESEGDGSTTEPTPEATPDTEVTEG